MVTWEKDKWAKMDPRIYVLGNPDDGNFIEAADDGSKQWICNVRAHAVGRRTNITEAKAAVASLVKEREALLKVNAQLGSIFGFKSA